MINLYGDNQFELRRIYRLVGRIRFNVCLGVASRALFVMA